MNAQLQRLGKGDLKISYNKITNIDSGRKLSENMHKLLNYDLNVIVYNFVDMLSHARTDMKVIKELAEGDAAYRSLTASWFEHSPLRDMFNFIAENKVRVSVTTDHGTILVKKPTKVLVNETCQQICAISKVEICDMTQTMFLKSKIQKCFFT